MKPPSIDSTSFTLVDDLESLAYLADKLSEANEFAVDLENNSFRSYQGITCLLQISTRDADFVVDPFTLRDHIGPYLLEYFQDARKRKVMHGANNDILWLQRDFGIYVCNLFDTMQASKVLKLERNSLEFLLKHYCGVIANKEYQASDWRLRPLPYEMLKYARKDTHYLLYIQDLMLEKLHDSRHTGYLAVAFKKSYEVCVQMYKKPVFNYWASYRQLPGLAKAHLDVKQRNVVVALYAWRDKVARKEDESTGYILPNKLLLEIAMKLPMSKNQLLQITGPKKHIVKNADLLIETIRQCVGDDDVTSGSSGKTFQPKG
ncbi:Protein RRP6-like 1 [Bienertia sinuspersici]